MSTAEMTRHETACLTVLTLTCGGKTLGRPCSQRVSVMMTDHTVCEVGRIDAQLVRLLHMTERPLDRYSETRWQFDDLAEVLIGSSGMWAQSASGVTARCPHHQIEWPREAVSAWTPAFNECVSDLSVMLLEMEQRLGLPHSPLGRRYDKLVARHGGVEEYNRAVESSWSRHHA